MMYLLYALIAIYGFGFICLLILAEICKAFESDAITVLLSIIFWPVVVVGVLCIGAYDYWLDWNDASD